MSVANGVIINPVGWWEPYQCLGLAPYNNTWDAGYICANTHGRINAWSIFKPIAANTAFYTPPVFFLPAGAWDDPNTSGWELVNMGNGKISGAPNRLAYNLHYKTPVTPYRMTDWNGYNHYSVAPAFSFQTQGWYGLGQGTSGMDSPSVTEGKGVMFITYPTIRPGALPKWNPGDESDALRAKARLEVVAYLDQTTTGRKVIWSLDCSEITAAQWATNYAGKTVQIQFTQNFRLPGPGLHTDTMYYMEINGCNYANGLMLNANNRMFCAWTRDPSFESNWEDGSPTKPTGYDVFGDFRRLKGKAGTGQASDADFKYRVSGLWWNTMSNFPVKIYVAGTLAVTVSNTEVTYHNGAALWQNTNPNKNNQYTYTISGTAQSVYAWDFDIQMPSKSFDATVEITVGNQHDI